jgi:hypothetical protein
VDCIRQLLAGNGWKAAVILINFFPVSILLILSKFDNIGHLAILPKGRQL